MTLPKALAAAAFALLASACALAAPFATTYTGYVTLGSTLPGAATDEPYTLTLVFNNGGDTANSQSWDSITCAIWRMNGGSMALRQPGGTATGTVTTSPSGALTAMFASVTGLADLNNSTATGFNPALVLPVYWAANGTNPVFVDSDNHGFGDVEGGVQLTLERWTAPVRVVSSCDDTPYATPTPTAVPTLGHAALALLAGSLGTVGFIGRRRNTPQP